MGRSFRAISWLTGVAAVLVAVPLSSPSAQTVGLFNGSVIQVNGLQFTVGGCEYATNGATLPTGINTSCGTAASSYAEITAQGGPGSAVLIDKSGGGAIFSSTDATGNDELKFTLTITPSTSSGATAKTKVTNAVTTLSGSAGGTGNNGLVTDTISYNNLSSVTGGGALDLTTLSATNNFAKQSGSFSFSYTEDLKLNTQAGTTLALRSLLLRLNPAPEPVTIGIFLVGLAGMGAARRARKKARGTA
jgi:hypothetical protein